MAKLSLKVEAQLTPAQMRRLNPHLKRKRLTIQQAVERGLKERIPAVYLDTTAFLAAIEGVGLNLEGKKTYRELKELKKLCKEDA